MSHSPGPWRWDGAETNWFLRDHAGRAVMRFDGDNNSWTPNDADAALIAAAPELLAMLREMEWVKDEECTAGDGLSCPCCGLVKHTTGHSPDCRLSALLGRLK